MTEKSHCNEHDNRTSCIMAAKKDADQAKQWCRDLSEEIRTRLPIWTFNVTITVLVIVLGGMCGMLMNINLKVNEISTTQIKMIAVENEREKQGRRQ